MCISVDGCTFRSNMKLYEFMNDCEVELLLLYAASTWQGQITTKNLQIAHICTSSVEEKIATFFLILHYSNNIAM